MPRKKFTTSLTDMFCGAGGSSQGAAATGKIEVTLALNHWELAVRTHNSNFPNTSHDCVDVSATDPRRYVSTDMLITSPECTNHSIAKGSSKQRPQLDLFGKLEIDPSADRSRATMWDVVRFAEYHRYNIIIVENVVDARSWVLFPDWLKAMHTLGYDHEAVYFNSMFAHPTPQSRDRMYVIFWRRGNKRPNLNIKPTAFCQKCGRNVASIQSWKNQQRRYGRYRQSYVYRCENCTDIVDPYYYAAANAVDWSLPAPRIGSRAKPLKERTRERVKIGLARFGGQSLVIPLAYTHGHNDRAKPMTDPIPTHTARQDMGIAVSPMPFLVGAGGAQGQRDKVTPVTSEHPTQLTEGYHALVTPVPFLSLQYTPGYNVPITDPAATVTCWDHHAIVTPAPFLTSVNYFKPNHAASEPMPTQTTGEHYALTVPPYIIELHGTSDVRGINQALSTVATSGAHHGLVVPKPFLVSYYGTGGESATDEPIPTVTTLERHALVRPQPDLQVDDCGFRMLQPHEIQSAMAFPLEYIILGTNRDKVRQLGNAVTPPVMELLVNRCLESLER